MSRHVALSAFLVTVAIAVPAGWRALDADIQSDGPALRPERQTLELDDASVTVDLDRGAMRSGDTATVTLVASAETAHEVTVDVTALQDMGYGGERVQNPPMQVGDKTIRLHAQPGGGPPAIASFKLGKHKAPLGNLEWIDFRVSEHGHHKGDSAAAVLGLATWSGNSFDATLEPPASIPSEGPFTVALRIKNTTKKPLANLYPDVGERFFGLQGLDVAPQLTNYSDADYKIEEVEQPKPEAAAAADSDNDSDDSDKNALAPGAERLFIYHVEPTHPGVNHFTFVAYVRSTNGGAMSSLVLDRPELPEPAPAVTALK